MKRFQASGVLLGALVAGLRCQPIPATEVLVRFGADPGLRERASRLKVEVRSQEGELVLQREKALTPGAAELARVPVVPRDDDASRFFSVRGELFDAAGASLGVERAMLSYVKEEVAEALLVFDEACATVADCGDGQRCQAGVCVGACIDAVSGHAERESPPRCSPCQRCAANRCEPLEDGAACGCAGDICQGGACVVATKLLSVALGISHCCALVREGSAYCWGANDAGQLGIDTKGQPRSAPTHVLDIDSFWIDVHATAKGTCAHAGDLTRYCWGENGLGQFGSGTANAGRTTPEQFDKPRVSELTAGGNHFCGLEEDTIGLWCWGSNYYGQLGIGSAYATEPTPQRVINDGIGRVSMIRGGGGHTCVIGADDAGNSIWCWGFNASGQLGVADLIDRTTPAKPGCEPGQPGEACVHDWQDVSLGTYHTCAIRAGGELWCWGGNGNSQVGVGTIGTNERTPLHLNPPSGWTAVSAGFQHTCAIRDDGSLWCWGNGERGQLGNGQRDRQSLPVQVISPPGPGRWARVFTSGGPGPGSGQHTCAIRSDQGLWCWGQNDQGQLGLGFTSESVATPRRVCFPK